MKLRSTDRFTERYTINEILGEMCTVTIVDLESEKEIIHEDSKSYEYDCEEVFVVHNVSFIESHLDVLYANAKAKEGLMDVSIEQRLEAIEEAILELAVR